MVNDGYEKTDVKKKKKGRGRLNSSFSEGKSFGFGCFLTGAPLKPGILEFGGGVDVRGVSRLLKLFMGWGKVAPQASTCCLMRATIGCHGH